MDHPGRLQRTTPLYGFASLCLLLILAGEANAQKATGETIPFLETYERETLFIKSTLWGQSYVKAGKQKSIGWFGKALKKEMQPFSECVLEMDRFARFQKASFAAWGLGAAAWWEGGVLWRKDHRVEAGALYGIGTISYLTYWFLSTKARTSLQKAAWLYNRRILQNHLGKTSLRFQLQFQETPSFQTQVVFSF